MEKNTLKRIISFILTAVLLLSAMPWMVSEDAYAAGNSFTTVSVGDGGYVMTIKSNGELWGWGSNKYGTIGDGTTETRSTPVKILEDVVTVIADKYTTLAIKSNSELWGWGGIEEYGQLGKGSLVPVKILDGIASVATGNRTTAAIKTNGELWAWGYGIDDDGQSGYDKVIPVRIMEGIAKVSIGDGVIMAVKTNGELWGANIYGQQMDGNVEHELVPVKILDGVSNVSAGSTTMAIKTNGELWGWGDNSRGQLGYVSNYDYRNLYRDGVLTMEPTYQETPVKIMDGVSSVSRRSGNAGYILAVKANGELWGWGVDGYHHYGERDIIGYTNNGTSYGLPITAPVKIMDNVISASNGIDHVMALKTNGELWGWGSNIYGQVGVENDEAQVKVMDGVVAVAANDYFTLATKANGELWAWGWGPVGNDSARSTSPIKVMDGIKIPGSNTAMPDTTAKPSEDKPPQNTSKDIAVYLNGNPITFDQPPIISNGRTLVPIRAIAEALGLQVIWDAATRTVILVGDNGIITLFIDDTTVSVNGETQTIDVPPTILNGRTLVPARFVAESLGCKVDWDDEDRTVIITAEDQVDYYAYDDSEEYPIVVVPGTMGCWLKEDYQDMVNKFSDYFSLGLIDNLAFTVLKDQLSAGLQKCYEDKPEFRYYYRSAVLGKIYYIEPVQDSYAPLFSRFEANGLKQDEDYFIFGYDTIRNPIEQSGYELAQYIENVLKTTGAKKVKIVAHSQGNLVARSYIEFNDGYKYVDKFVMVAPPNYGVPYTYGLYHKGRDDNSTALGLDTWGVDVLVAWMSWCEGLGSDESAKSKFIQEYAQAVKDMMPINLSPNGNPFLTALNDSQNANKLSYIGDITILYNTQHSTILDYDANKNAISKPNSGDGTVPITNVWLPDGITYNSVECNFTGHQDMIRDASGQNKVLTALGLNKADFPEFGDFNPLGEKK